MTIDVLFDSYTAFAERHRERHPMSRDTFGRFLVNIAGARPKRLKDAPTGEHITEVENPPGSSRMTRAAELIMKDRPHGYLLGTLPAAKTAFETKTRIPGERPDDQ